MGKRDYNCSLLSVDEEFDKIKDCKFSTLSAYTLEDIVRLYNVLPQDNEDIKTIRYFVNNEDTLTDQVLEYDEEGLSDGYHRLIAMKICEFEYFEFKLEDYD